MITVDDRTEWLAYKLSLLPLMAAYEKPEQCRVTDSFRFCVLEENRCILLCSGDKEMRGRWKEPGQRRLGWIWLPFTGAPGSAACTHVGAIPGSGDSEMVSWRLVLFLRSTFSVHETVLFLLF